MTSAVQTAPASMIEVPAVRSERRHGSNRRLAIGLAAVALLVLAVGQWAASGACSGTGVTAETIELPRLSAAA